MASAATASAPTPPAAGSPASGSMTASSTFSRMSGDAVSALFTSTTTEASAASSSSTSSKGNVANTTLSAPHTPALLSSSRQGQRSSSIGGDSTASSAAKFVQANLAAAKTTSVPLPPPPPTSGSDTLPSTTAAASAESKQAPQPRSTSSSGSSSSWTAAARNASLAPYRVLAAALPSILNVSPGSAVASSSSTTTTAAEAGPSSVPAVVDSQLESDDDDGQTSGANTAWQTPEMGGTLQIAIDSPRIQSAGLGGREAQPSTDPSSHIAHSSPSSAALSPAMTLLHAISAASNPVILSSSSEANISPATTGLALIGAGQDTGGGIEVPQPQATIHRRLSQGVVSLVHVHETAPTSDSDWEPDSEEDEKREDEEVSDSELHAESPGGGTGGVHDDDDEDDDRDEVDSMHMAYHDDTIKAASVHQVRERLSGSASTSSAAAAAVAGAETSQERRARRRQRRHRRQKSAFYSISSNGVAGSSAAHGTTPPIFMPRTSSMLYDLHDPALYASGSAADADAVSLVPASVDQTAMAPAGLPSGLMPSPVLQDEVLPGTAIARLLQSTAAQEGGGRHHPHQHHASRLTSAQVTPTLCARTSSRSTDASTSLDSSADSPAGGSLPISATSSMSTSSSSGGFAAPEPGAGAGGGMLGLGLGFNMMPPSQQHELNGAAAAIASTNGAVLNKLAPSAEDASSSAPPGSGVVGEAVFEPEIAMEDEFLYYRLRTGAAPATLHSNGSDRGTVQAPSTIGLVTPHPSMHTLNPARPGSSHESGASIHLGRGSTDEIAEAEDEESAVLPEGAGGVPMTTTFSTGLVASPTSIDVPIDDDQFGAFPGSGSSTGVTPLAHTPKRLDSSEAAPRSQQSTPATIVPGNATLLPSTPENAAAAAADDDDESDGPPAVPAKKSPPSASGSSGSGGAQAAAKRQQLAAARAEHRRELQRLALLELVRTERSYADDLALLVMVFFENLVILPSFAPALGSGSGSEIDRSDSRSGTESEDVQDGTGQDSAEEGGADRSWSRGEGGTGAASLHPPPPLLHTRSSSSNASGHAPSPTSSSNNNVTMAFNPSARRTSDPTLERLDLVTRNAEELLSLHQSAAWRLEAIVAQYGLDHPESDPNVKVKVSVSALEEGTRKVAEYLGNTLAPALRELYAPFCSKHMEALAVVKDAERRSAAEWLAYERTCAEILQVVAARISPTLPSPSPSPAADVTTQQAAAAQSGAGAVPTTPVESSHPAAGVSSSAHPTSSPIAPLLGRSNKPHKLVFHDYFVKPIQRIALYPLMLQSLLKYCTLPNTETEDGADGGGLGVIAEGVKSGTGKDREAVRGAVEALVAAVEHVNEAGRLRLEQRLSQMIADRMESHFNVTPNFLHSLGHCLLSGTLDVLYHQRSTHPLSSPLRLKYHGCVLYKGFMLIVKARKSATYEPKFWFPLWLAHLSDVTEESRFLPHAFRLSVRDHHFELVASNARERQLWITALSDAIVKAPLTPPGTEASFPSSLSFGGNGDHGSRPSSRGTQRASSRMSMHGTGTGSPGAGLASGAGGEAVEELDFKAVARMDASPRKHRFSTGNGVPGFSTTGRTSNPSSPATASTAQFDGAEFSPNEDAGEDVLQQYFEETAEIQVRRSSPYQRNVIDRAMVFSASVIAARAPRSAHDVSGAAGSAGGSALALGNSFALAAPAHGPGWQQSLGALVGLGRMGSIETSTLKVQRRKSCAGNVEGVAAFAPIGEVPLPTTNSVYLSSTSSSLAASGGGSPAVPFPATAQANGSNGMSNRAMRTLRQLSIKTASRPPSVRPLSEIFPAGSSAMLNSATTIPSPALMPVEAANSTVDSNTSEQQVSSTSLALPTRAPSSRRESFASNLRDALTVSFGRRQRSQSSQDIEQDSTVVSAGATDPGSYGPATGINTPYLPSSQQSPSMHASLVLTPVHGDADVQTKASGGRADSIRRVFGSIRGKRERTLSMPVAPEPLLTPKEGDEASIVPPMPGAEFGAARSAALVTGMAGASSSGAASLTASRDSLVGRDGPFQVTVTQGDEDGREPPPPRSLSRASMQRSRTALGKIWFGNGSSSEGGSGFLSVGGLGRLSTVSRRNTDSFAASRSKSAVALPTFSGSSSADAPQTSARASISGSPTEASEQGIYFSTGGEEKGSQKRLSVSESNSHVGSLAIRRPRLNLKLSTNSHRLSAAPSHLPTLPATPADEIETPLGSGPALASVAVSGS